MQLTAAREADTGEGDTEKHKDSGICVVPNVSTTGTPCTTYGFSERTSLSGEYCAGSAKDKKARPRRADDAAQDRASDVTSARGGNFRLHDNVMSGLQH